MMLLRYLALTFCLSWYWFPDAEGSRILFLSPLGSKSHKIFFMGLMEPLAKKGHHITMVSSSEPSKEIENIREVVVQSFVDDHLVSVFKDESSVIKSLFVDSPRYCVDSLQEKQVQDLKEEHFDLIIISMFFDYCYLSLVHHFKVPFIYASPAGLFGPFADIMSSVELPSITPNKILEPVFPPTFIQRLLTQVLNLVFGLGSTYYIEPKMMNLCKERGLCPPDMPSFSEINSNASMAIINSVRTLETPKPSMPNIIYAGGAHMKPPQELPKDLEKWIADSGEDGFIFFSLGSALKPSFLPEEYRKVLIKVFGSLKQRVLWKWDQETMPDLPPNVKLSKWLPQTDILGHPKLRIFITHGGLLSTLESTYNGVPIIGMPVFADQFANMKEVESEGWGRVMLWKELTETKFKTIINDLLQNNKYRETSQARSALMKDIPIPPAEEAAFWIEYVIRHKGAPHLMSPVRFLKWYQIFNQDVWAFLIAVMLLTFYLMWRTLKFMLGFCFGKKASPSLKKKRE